jgi:hypothetical protein
MSGGYAVAHDRLCVALEQGAQGVRTLRRPGVAGETPLAYVQPPTLSWDGFEIDPTEAVFEVILAVAADEKAIERLFDLLPQVTNALDQAEDAVVKSAEPGVWRAGASELPAYFIRVEVAI